LSISEMHEVLASLVGREEVLSGGACCRLGTGLDGWFDGEQLIGGIPKCAQEFKLRPLALRPQCPPPDSGITKFR
jgi:hypothetical protein